MKSTRWWAYCLLSLIALGLTWGAIDGPDFWWHMKIGDWIRANGLIPDRGLYSATQADARYVYQSWGSEVLYSWMNQLGGLPLIHLARNLLVVGAYGLLVWHSFQRGANGRAAAVALLFAVCIAFDNWIVRPQMFSMPLFMLMVIIPFQISRERWSRWWILALPMLQIIWANVHGAFILGPIIVGTWALGAVLDRRRKLEPVPSNQTIQTLWIGLSLTMLAIVVNPQGLGIITYVWTLLTDPGSQQLGSEWASPLSQPTYPLNMFFFLIAFMGSIILWSARKHMRSADMLLWAGFLILTLTGMRYMLWFGFIAGPILVEALTKISNIEIFKTHQEKTPILGIIGSLLIGSVILSQAPWRGSLPLPERWEITNTPIARAELISNTTPLQAIELIRAEPPSGKLFHSEAYGSYLIWRLGEQVPVFIDTRIELYPIEQWYEYLCISNAKDWQALFARYNITSALLERQTQTKLIEALQQDRAWNEIYADDLVVLFHGQPNPSAAETALNCSLLIEESHAED